VQQAADPAQPDAEADRAMTKRSRVEQAQRAAEHDRIREIEAAWVARLSAEEKAAFRRDVESARARQPEPRPDMAPGTAPNPPRPGREPREPKVQTKGRSRH
jgi:hypothetical protein